MKTQRIKIKESLKDWAFKTTDVNEQSLEKMIQNNKWLQKDNEKYLYPTVKQLGSFARKLHISFGNLLLNEPPKTEDIRLAFRTKDNAPADVSLTVRDIIYEMKRKQDWFRDESGFAKEKLSFVGSAEGLDNYKTLKEVNNLITLKHFNNARELFNDLRNQFSYLGILSMQKGSAGLGTQRPIDVNEMRAFVFLDEFAPLIFINQKDSYTARIFSLVHEFIHILHGTDELLKDNENDISEERNINKITSEFLMPEKLFKDKFNSSGSVEETARYFNTSPFATVIRIKELHLVKDIKTLDIPEAPKNNQKKGSGGNPYNTALSFNDNRYMEALISAQSNGNLQPTKAASLMGISYKMLDRTVSTFNEREEYRNDIFNRL